MIDMENEMLDDDGYPTEQALKLARELSCTESAESVYDSLQEIWHWPDLVKIKIGSQELELHTGGWSGNEETIIALKASMFWMFCWMRSERGGHYYFDLSRLVKEPK